VPLRVFLPKRRLLSIEVLVREVTRKLGGMAYSLAGDFRNGVEAFAVFLPKRRLLSIEVLVREVTRKPDSMSSFTCG
jgi:hypothetical protein